MCVHAVKTNIFKKFGYLKGVQAKMWMDWIDIYYTRLLQKIARNWLITYMILYNIRSKKSAMWLVTERAL